MLAPSLYHDTATTELYTLSLHDALPISSRARSLRRARARAERAAWRAASPSPWRGWRTASARSRSEEHTSELQSPYDLVCRLLLEKKKETSDESHTM